MQLIQATAPSGGPKPTPKAPPPLRVERRVPAAAPEPASAPWDRQSYRPAGGLDAAPPEDALAKGKAIFAISEAKSKAEARQTGEFFGRYPSNGASQVTLFHTYWAQHQTFQKVPLQAFLYSKTRPTDEQGRPKNALWQRYADLVATGASPKAIESAFFRAHVNEFKEIVKTPEFKALYAVSTPKYRRVVEAYLDTLTQSERELDAGGDATQTSRWLFPRTVVWLSRNKVRDNGFMATWEGAKAMLELGSPLNRQFWGATRDIVGSVLFNRQAERKAPTKVLVSLSAEEAAKLKQETGIPFVAGRQELTDTMLAHAAVAEPERRRDPKAPAPTYPLRLSDFLAADKLHEGGFQAGEDGVMDATEIKGVIQHVQGLARSQLIEAFYAKYPAPHAGVHLYSANMLSMNGAYASPMANTLANAIMPVDNTGKPKNAAWQAYADACDSRQATGSPSAQVVERLWWKAHMADFMIIDTPGFQKLLGDFWRQEAQDPALKPLGTYARAMITGRANFERDRKTTSEDRAFVTFIRHFTTTIVKDGAFPFWRQDLEEAAGWLKNRNAPELDDRGLPTDATLFARAAKGLGEMTGLRHTIARGLKQMVTRTGDRTPVDSMVDLAKVLTPAQLAQVDPRVLAFYKNPARFDVHAGTEVQDGLLSQLVMGTIAPRLAGMSKLPDRVEGFENYPLESEIYQDDQGGTHWDRYVMVDGERKPLFLAKFETEGKQVKETFSVRGKEVALYFDVVPHQGGVRLTLDQEKSSKLVTDDSNIVFTVTPGPGGLKTVGEYHGQDGRIGQTFTMTMAPKPAPAIRVA